MTAQLKTVQYRSKNKESRSFYQEVEKSEEKVNKSISSCGDTEEDHLVGIIRDGLERWAEHFDELRNDHDRQSSETEHGRSAVLEEPSYGEIIEGI